MKTVKNKRKLSKMDKTEQVLELKNRISQLEQENLLLKEKVDFLTRKLFGRSTEQTSKPR